MSDPLECMCMLSPDDRKYFSALFLFTAPRADNQEHLAQPLREEIQKVNK